MDALRNFTSWMGEMASKYGPAWIVTTQALGWTSFFIIYLTLSFLSPDFAKQVVSKITSSEDILSLAGTTAGQFGLAFALNRLLTPLRLMLVVAILPHVAEPINGVVRSVQSSLGFKGKEAVGEKGETKKGK